MALYDLTKSKVKDVSEKLIDPDDYTAAVAEALKRYSKDRPRRVCDDIAGEDGPDIALPSGWVDGISTIEAIEYPVGQVPESLLDSRDWRFYRTPTDIYIRFSVARPASGEIVRVLFTTVYTETTAPVSDLEAIANLAASICCRQLAAAFAQTSDPTIMADSVNYGSKTDEFRRLADSLEKLYKTHLGIRETDTAAAAMATAPPPDPVPARLTHARR